MSTTTLAKRHGFAGARSAGGMGGPLGAPHEAGRIRHGRADPAHPRGGGSRRDGDRSRPALDDDPAQLRLSHLRAGREATAEGDRVQRGRGLGDRLAGPQLRQGRGEGRPRNRVRARRKHPGVDRPGGDGGSVVTRYRVALWVLLAGKLLGAWGLTWDILWHLLIGRDTF